MANVKITDLTALSGALADADLFEMVDDVAGTPASRKVTAAVVREFTNMAQATGANANTTMAVNTLYVVDMSAWATADRTYTLPATAAVGDQIAIKVTAGNASYELIITAASGDTLEGIAGGTEWSRLFISGESVLMRCTVADTTWVIAPAGDGRIPAYARVKNTGFSLTGSTIMYPDWTVVSDPYSMYKNLTIDALQLRRGGMYELYMVALSQLLADGKTMYGRIVSDPNGTPVVLSDYRALTGATNLRITPTPYWRDVFAVDTYVTGHLYHNDATGTCGLIEFIVTERFK